jgi:hypothetical protein
VIEIPKFDFELIYKHDKLRVTRQFDCGMYLASHMWYSELKIKIKYDR